MNLSERSVGFGPLSEAERLRRKMKMDWRKINLRFLAIVNFEVAQR